MSQLDAESDPEIVAWVRAQGRKMKEALDLSKGVASGEIDNDPDKLRNIANYLDSLELNKVMRGELHPNNINEQQQTFLRGLALRLELEYPEQ